MDQVIEPSGPLRGSIRVPGDKSVSHRALILGAMARGRTRVARCAPGDDVASTARCLESLGVEMIDGGELLTLRSPGWKSITAEASLDAGNSGTTMRLLTGALASIEGAWVISGDESLSRRPMDRIAVPLEMMGATVSLREERFPPIRLKGGSLHGIHYDMPMASAQVKSAVLLAGLGASGETFISETFPTRDHTERILAWLGLDIDWRPGLVELNQGGDVPSFDLEVPGDFSSAAFLIAPACLIPGSALTIEGVGLNPSRTGFLDIMKSMGSSVSQAESSSDPEPVGSVYSETSELVGIQIEESLVAQTIDELLLVAVLATAAEGQTTISGASELRVKESDRIAALGAGLRELGADLEDTEDGLVVQGPTKLKGGVVESAGDHRIALAFAVAAMIAAEPVTIRGWECTSVSYPSFLDDVRVLAE